MKVLWVTNVPSPYRVDFFNEFGKYVDLTVLFEKKTSDERDKSWLDYKFENFTGVFLKGKSINTDSAICPDVVRYVNDKTYEHIVVTSISSPTGIIAISYMRIHHIEYWIEGDGGFAKTGKGIKNRLKTYMIMGAKGYFSTSRVHDEYYLTYGASKDKIHRYPFTSIKKKDLLHADELRCKKVALRNELGINEDRIIISVGQFIYRKGFDVLLRAASKIDSDIGIYIIGGEPTVDYKQLVKRYELKNIHFIGFENKETLCKYYAASDMFVLPTREDIWGLVINEAMAFSLPIITTNRCIAGLELVEPGKNGFIIPPDDYGQLARAIMSVFNGERIHEYGEKSRAIINDYTIEKMADDHVLILEGEL